MTNVSNSNDIIDSRDVENKIDELEQVVQDAEDAVEDADSDVDMDEVEEAKEELAILQAFKEEATDVNSEWDDGACFIRETYFETYAQELAADIGDYDPSAQWPMSCIDWAEAADQLKQDYSVVDFDGVEYFVQST